MKAINIFIIFLLLIPNKFLKSEVFNSDEILVQENGRVKPFDTFARNNLLAILSKRSLKSSALPNSYSEKQMSASDWLFEISTKPYQAHNHRIFNIQNPELVRSMGLDWDDKHLFTAEEVLLGLQNKIEYINKIQNLDESQLSSFDELMLRLYRNFVLYQELKYSLSCLLPIIPINNNEIALLMDVENNTKVSYYNIISKIDRLRLPIQNMLDKESNNWDVTEQSLSQILMQMKEINQDKFAQKLKLIPPQEESKDDIWLSPWEIVEKSDIDNNQKRVINSLEKLINAKIKNDRDEELLAMSSYSQSVDPNYRNYFTFFKIQKEVWLNKTKIFIKSTMFYLLAFLLLSISWIVKPKFLKLTALIMLVFGSILHSYGIILRVIIMARPPVSTLYESIIFVNLISVIFALILEFKRRDGVGIFVGSVCGIVLHYVGFGYANDGDTLGMLVAVLNSNFWLATHVTTITTGYGASLFAGLLGHIYLVQAFMYPNDNKYLKTLSKNMLGATLFALFFTLFGTILGGIWADQSWGRFWGWDPKENGALLIVMWQIMLLHMRITGMAKPQGFAFGLILNNIVVVMAWFGVNLLSVGLHSYGFASGIARNLIIFTILELSIGVILYFLVIKNLKSRFT